MKNTVTFTSNARLDNPDYLRISAFAYAHLKEVMFSVFGRVFSERTFFDSEGGLTKNFTILGPQAESFNDTDTDFLITKQSEFAVQNQFRNRNFTLDKKAPVSGGSSKWRFKIHTWNKFYNSQGNFPLDESSFHSSNRFYGLYNPAAQIEANKTAHDNQVFGSTIEASPEIDLSDFVRATEARATLSE